MMDPTVNTSMFMNPDRETQDGGIFKFILFLMVGIFTVIVNLFVIVVISIKPSLHTRANMYIVSLASTDLIVGLITFLTGIHFIDGVREVFNTHVVLCLLMFVTGYSAVFCSVLHTCLIALDRYFCIFYTLHFMRLATSKRVKYVIASTWLVAIIIGISPVTFYEHRENRVCYRDKLIPDIYHKYVGTSFFLIGCSVTAVVYSRMGCHSYNTIKLINSFVIMGRSKTAIRQSRSSIRYTIRKSSKNKTFLKINAFMKTVKLFAVIFGCFFLCWLPYFILLYIPNASQTLFEYFVLLGYLNSGINGCVYGYIDIDIRRASKKILCPHRTTGSHHRGMTITRPSFDESVSTSILNYSFSSGSGQLKSTPTMQTELNRADFSSVVSIQSEVPVNVHPVKTKTEMNNLGLSPNSYKSFPVALTSGEHMPRNSQPDQAVLSLSVGDVDNLPVISKQCVQSMSSEL